METRLSDFDFMTKTVMRKIFKKWKPKTIIIGLTSTFQIRLTGDLYCMKSHKRFLLIMMTACKSFVISILIIKIDMCHVRENMLEVIKCHL